MLNGYEEEYVERCRARRSRATSGQGAEWLIPLLVILGIVLWSATRAGATPNRYGYTRNSDQIHVNTEELILELNRTRARLETLEGRSVLTTSLTHDVTNLRAQVVEQLKAIDRLRVEVDYLAYRLRYESLADHYRAKRYKPISIWTKADEAELRAKVRRRHQWVIKTLGPCPPWPWKRQVKTKEKGRKRE